MKKRASFIIAVVLLMGIGAFTGYSLFASDGKDSAKQVEQQAQSIEDIQAAEGKPVKVSSVAQQDITLTQTFYGTAKPYAEANVQCKYSGKIMHLNGKEGDSVQAGETIIQFEKTDASLAISQAEASKNALLEAVKQAESNFETAQKTVARNQELFKQGFLAKQSLDELQNSLQVAQAALSSAREQVKTSDASLQMLRNKMKDLTITAPISGIIDKKNFNENEIPGANDTIYHIVDIHQVYIDIDVPETYISQIRENMPIDVLFDSLSGQKFQGIVERIIPTGNAANRNFTAKVLVENPALMIKPGMFARANAAMESIPNALLLDKKALLQDQDQYYVYKVADGQAQKAIVDVKYRDERRVGVVSTELAASDQVVIEGARMLSPNDRVKVL
ncbi:efflux transporter, RND family, MFP subunit [Candidatus Moduliflexus flocculans]|uniref:Efflux transporter, RND family, MFP subunit n=1 Tax=Candidatus Moduliflexus flocculans TaxID=1499966 RepID=A0A0S6VTL5_9BACT|nr:efflux transporter, RND family, MFP subunit [Candidatus Moduliflexus flocculans]